MAVKFKVKRISVSRIMCKACGGTGYNTVKHNNQSFKNKCHNYGCKEGIITNEHETDVDLVEALKELGLIN